MTRRTVTLLAFFAVAARPVAGCPLWSCRSVAGAVGVQAAGETGERVLELGDALREPQDLGRLVG